MKKYAKQLSQWILALICAVLLLNTLCFAFYHPVHEMPRSGGATPGLKYPHMWGLYGTEGYGVQMIDSHGYINPDLPREKEMICVLGSSNTEGFTIEKGARFSDLLNRKFGYADTLKFYNIAHSGLFFDDMVRHFDGLCEEFPEMQGLIIELIWTKHSPEALRAALDQSGFSAENDTIEGLTSSLTTKQRLVIAVKNWFPLLRLFTNQYETYKNSKSADLDFAEFLYSDEGVSDPAEYEQALNEVFDMMRERFDGPIIIVYHPMTTLDEDGNLVFSTAETDEIFRRVCEAHDVDFVDMTEAFSKAYYEDHIAVHGFWNTSMMTGHMNDDAHRLIADELYELLQEKGIN